MRRAVADGMPDNRAEALSPKRKITNKSLTANKSVRHAPDYQFLFLVIILVAFGLIMVFSASFPSAYYNFGDGYYFISKQVIWAAIGFVAMFITTNMDYHKWGRLSFSIFVVSIILLIAVKIPGIGINVNGARRWIGVGTMRFQPSELAKLAVIIYFSYSLSVIGKNIKLFKKGLLRYLLILGLYGVLLILQPHFSAFVLIAATACVILLVAGARVTHFMLLGTPAVMAAAALVITSPYRMQRMVSFLDPLADKLGDGWQITQSLYAIASGGIFGLGFTNSRQKFMYLPEPHNDFIFSVICEELGLVGAIAVVVLFAALIWRGYKIAMSAKDTFGCYLAVGITSLVALQTVINIGVVSASMPVTGMPLPFFSAGGSSLVFLMAAMGIVLNISKYSTSDLSRKSPQTAEK